MKFLKISYKIKNIKRYYNERITQILLKLYLYTSLFILAYKIGLLYNLWKCLG